jgi:RNA polymerase sigma-70 factor (ECF subfamily)
LAAARDPDVAQRFELLVMPHLAAGYNLARWLTRNEHDAEDLVQDAYLRAFRAFDGYRGGDARVWLLKIVRNTCYTWLRQRRGTLAETAADDPADLPDDLADAPEAQVIRCDDGLIVRDALDALPVEFREAVVLRELEGLSYKEIAEATGTPIGTVMSRLSRGRKLLQESLRRRMGGAEP